jgi:hypothetical protein
MESTLNLNVPRVFTRISELDTGETDKCLEPREMLAFAVEHMTLGKHKDKRENWTLKNFFFHYNRTQTLQMQTYQWAARGEPPNEPDYLVCSRFDSRPLFVEVTELLDKRAQARRRI